MERENFKSRLGFLLVSAGCAIGIGNVWKFPFITGQNGGGVFVLFYLIFLVIMGVPVLTMELAVGRASRQSAVKGYKALEPEGSKWHIHGWFCIIGCYLLMMYYTTVSGWMFDYFVKFLTGTFDGMASESVGDVFGNMLGNTKEMALFMCIMVVAGVFVCSIGIQDGLEKISKFMMLALMVLILVLAVHSLSLSGAAEGIKFYLPRKCHYRGDESGVLHAVARYSIDGDLRQLHDTRIYTRRRSDPYLCTRYICRDRFRSYHFPGMFLIWRRDNCGTGTHFHHAAAGIYPYGRRKDMGNAVLPVHDICKLLDRYRGIREPDRSRY